MKALLQDWQRQPLSDEAVDRILRASNLAHEPARDEERAGRVRMALQKLANRDIHQAFEIELDKRTLNPIEIWISEAGNVADRRLARAVRNARSKGFMPPPPARPEYREALHRWTETELRRPRHPGRPTIWRDRARRERLLVCFWTLSVPQPRYSLHLTRETKSSAAAFAYAYLQEVFVALQAGHITDPENRDRSPIWKLPAPSTLARQFGELDRAIWMTGDILDCGEVVWSSSKRPKEEGARRCKSAAVG
ncbi:MAG: hypothetical protein EOP84_00455 [Verrucomicrobiaceae bacterium]|nr:MAG: hypothetical protein EOP84_00455 [Verrucomicrobiaceae bacterium]